MKIGNLFVLGPMTWTLVTSSHVGVDDPSMSSTVTSVTEELRNVFMMVQDPLAEHHGRHRRLQDDDVTNVCVDAANNVDSCLPDNVQSDCDACMKESFNDAVSTLGDSIKDCQALARYTCAPVHACECLSQCHDPFTLYANCLSDAITTGAGLTGSCDVTCGYFKPTSGGAARAASAMMCAVGAVAAAVAGLMALASA